MKKNWIILAISVLATLSSCSNEKAAPKMTGKIATTSTENVTAIDNKLDLVSVAGTYEGTLPAADCPGIKTELTIKADSTYELKQDYIDRKDGHDEAAGIFKVLKGNVLMLVRPSSGEHTFYKMKGDDRIIMTDSLGNEPEGATAKLYVLKKRK